MTAPGDAPPALPDPHDSAEAGPDRATLARRVIGFDVARGNRLATTTVHLTAGIARVSADLPLVYGLSGIHLDRPAAPAELEQLILDHLGELPNHRVMTATPEVAWPLGGYLADTGWTVSRLVYMVHDGQTRPLLSPIGFDVVGVSTYEPYHRAFVAEQPWGADPAVVDQKAAELHRIAERVDARFVMARDGDAGCQVYRLGTTAQIEEVGVLAAARGRALGAGLLARAMQLGEDAPLLFLIADADDWPRTWYARLGFRPVASAWEWNRAAGA